MQGTGANFLATGVYFTFLFSFVLLTLTTAHFLIGATLEKVWDLLLLIPLYLSPQVVCETLQNPGQSDLFDQLDAEFIRPRLNDVLQEVGEDDSE